MATGPETRLQRRIQKEIRERYGPRVWLFKVHGSEFQPAGIPDLIGTLDGKFFALEVKDPLGKHPVSPVQHARIAQIRNTGAMAEVVESVEEALALLATLDHWVIKPHVEDHPLAHDDDE